METGPMAGAAAAQAIANAVKASGAIVQMKAEEFQSILERSERPLVVCAKGGFFQKNYRYLTNYRGLFFFTASDTTLRLPPDTEVVFADKISIPNI
jgi:ABC-type branched-subunit amino acid transport system substrate-binding protein